MTSQPNVQSTVVANHPYLELNNQGQILRCSLLENLHKLGRDPEWSDFNIPESGWNVISKRHAKLCQEGESYRIYDGDGKHPSTNGLFVNRTRINATEGYLLRNGVQLSIGQNPRNRILITYYNPQQGIPTGRPQQLQLPLQSVPEFPVEMGRAPNLQRYASMRLDAPTVSRLHATIKKNGKGQYCIENHGTNGTYVNDQAIHKPTLLRNGDLIRIVPFTLMYRHDVLELLDTGTCYRLDAHNLVRRVKDKAGKEKIILAGVSVPIEPGQLVALVGGSGTGKSTLMKTLLGIAPTTEGQVFVNGEDLRSNFDMYRANLGYVPQDDIVHGNLTVGEVLTYACRLRLPADTDVPRVVQETLAQVKLDFVRNSLVKNLSGGQRKRVSIAVELLANPKLFFLDEPTSGLDPGLDKEMMQLLRELANQGRTIILVTHATSNIEECDRVAFMGRGGKMCYFGPPLEALDFFAMPSSDLKYFADIYLKLDQGKTPEAVEENIQKWHSKFVHSQYYQQYVSAPLSLGQSTTSNPKPIYRKRRNPLQQLLLLSQRYVQLVKRDLRSLALALLTAPIGISLITLALSDKNPLVSSDTADASQAILALQVLFIFSCAALWVGLSGSVQEIVTEASIYARERLVNLGLFSYLFSKVLIRSGLAVVQTLLVVATVLVLFKSPQPELINWYLGLGITTFLTILSSTCLGFLVSAVVGNETEANNTLPLILIPQIIFSGIPFKLEIGIPSKLAWLMISRWSMGAYGSIVDVNSMVEGASYPPGIKPPFEVTDVYQADWQNLSLCWLILGLHMVVYLGITLWLQKRKDIF